MEKVHLDVIEEFFNTHEVADGAIAVWGTRGYPTQKFIKFHIQKLRDNPGDRSLMDVYDRLLVFYHLCNSKLGFATPIKKKEDG